MTRHPTLFGRKMQERGATYGIGGARVWHSAFSGEWHSCFSGIDAEGATPHAAARALERKIVAAHRRLGKLMAGTKGRSK